MGSERTDGVSLDRIVQRAEELGLTLTDVAWRANEVVKDGAPLTVADILAGNLDVVHITAIARILETSRARLMDSE